MTISRRHLLVATAAVAATSLGSRAMLAQSPMAQAPAGPFRLDPLPYAADALAPHIDARTMEIHHDRHHQAYVTNLNAAVKDHAEVAKLPLQDILARIGEMPEAVRTVLRNNAGGHANHTMFWQVMGAGGGQPDGELAAAITRDFGGLEALQTKFNDAGTRVFGSGWVFMTAARDGKLALETRPNQDSPLMDGKRVLFGNDVWEHAYYLSYQNRRADYLKAWWNVVSWSKVADRYAAAKAGTLAV